MHKKALNHAKEEVNDSVVKAIAVLDEAKAKLLEASNDIQRELEYTSGVRIFDQHVHQDIIESLKRVLETATMDNASFSEHHPFKGHDDKEHPDYDPKNPTPYIKDRTELWRQSWIIKPLEYALILLETARPWYEYEGEQARKRLEEQAQKEKEQNS